MLDLWLERFPLTAWLLYGARQWAAACASVIFGPIVADDVEWRREPPQP